MPHLRGHLRTRQPPHDHTQKVPSVSQLLDATGWHARALCASEPDPDLWFSEPHESGRAGEREALGTARSLAAVLLCVRCPVRRPCLTEALTPWQVRLGLGGARVGVRAVGIWGASTAAERLKLRSLPVAEAVDALEAGLPERVRERIEVFEDIHPNAEQSRDPMCVRARKMLDEMRGSLEAVRALSDPVAT